MEKLIDLDDCEQRGDETMSTYYVGWDVGAWHCEKNTKSKDCFCLLDENGCAILPYNRSCVSDEILQKECFLDFIRTIFPRQTFSKCDEFIIGIDAVFCWPKNFVSLINAKGPKDITYKPTGWEGAINNEILFRKTEYIIAHKHKPLSAVQGQIGSQSTKVIYFLKKYGFKVDSSSPGVWKSGKAIAIETYPAILDSGDHDDVTDAKLCAKLARVFHVMPAKLISPETEEEKEAAKEEGWIWVPRQPIEQYFPKVITVK